MAPGATRETPVGTADPTGPAWVTTVLVVANLAIFVGEVVASKSSDALMNVPLMVERVFGANDASLTLGLHQYDRLVAACFLHGSVLHVGVNMWSLWQIGPVVEAQAGKGRYALLYLLSGVGSSIASLAWGLVRGEPRTSVGASGAVCGVLAAALVLTLRLEGWRSPVAREIGFWLITIVGYGAVASHVDNGAHVGGLIVGALIAILWRRGAGWSRAATVACVGGCALVCAGAGLATVYRDITDPFANVAPNERSNLVVVALGAGDCAGAREALRATEAVAGGAPEVRGLRIEVARACPAGAP